MAGSSQIHFMLQKFAMRLVRKKPLNCLESRDHDLFKNHKRARLSCVHFTERHFALKCTGPGALTARCPDSPAAGRRKHPSPPHSRLSHPHLSRALSRSPPRPPAPVPPALPHRGSQADVPILHPGMSFRCPEDRGPNPHGL